MRHKSKLWSRADRTQGAVVIGGEDPAAASDGRALGKHHFSRFTAPTANGKLGPTGSARLRQVLFSVCLVFKIKMLPVRPALKDQEVAC